MKRILSLLLVTVMVLACFSGCGTTEEKPAVPDTPQTPDDTIQYESPEQEAVVKTALAFLARGDRIQYDDTRLSPNSQPVEYRWQHSLKSPEDYTTQFLGYTNCAAFTHDVYLEALDYDILSYTTSSLTQKGEPERVYKYWPSGDETEEEMAAMEAEFRSKLKMGDIIVIRYNGSRNGNGHAMLYVGAEVLEGNDGYRGTAAENTEEDGSVEQITYDIIHSTGSSYSYSNYTEKAEQYGSVQITSTDSLFDPSKTRYIFKNLNSIAIIRPLNVYTGGVPEKTQNRVKNMENIVAEKLSSHTYGMTVNPGDTMTFTFSIYNKNEKDVTLEVKDTIPSNTTYVSGAASEKNGTVSWNLPVPAKTTISVSYTVKVKEDAVIGDVVYSDAGTVGGVDVDCPKVYIANTLTEDEQTALKTAASSLAASGKRGLELANAVYNEVVGYNDLLPGDFAELMDGVYTMYGLSQYILNDEGGYLDMVVPGMFGGRGITPRVEGEYMDRLESTRTRLPFSRDLIVGDIIAALDGDDIENPDRYRLYLFTGDSALDLLSGETTESATVLNKILAYHRFAVLRPSMILG